METGASLCNSGRLHGHNCVAGDRSFANKMTSSVDNDQYLKKLIILIVINMSEAKVFCERDKIPLEIGHWRYNLKHMDSVVVQNKPVTINEGQIYVYDNFFPGYTIEYVHVDNLAMRTCGASASIKSGGIGSSSVLIVLHADSNQEIRSVVDIWGEKILKVSTRSPLWKLGNVTSLYLFRKFRAVNHNRGF